VVLVTEEVLLYGFFFIGENDALFHTMSHFEFCREYPEISPLLFMDPYPPTDNILSRPVLKCFGVFGSFTIDYYLFTSCRLKI
jgi:hypothetical protein